MHTIQIWEQDKKTVLNWLMDNCCGFRNAKTRADILPNLQFVNAMSDETKDRYFRRIVARLKKEHHVFSSSDRGYWFRPLVSNDNDEIQAELKALREDKAKAMDLLDGLDRRIKEIESSRPAQMAFM